jgi:hypothetical protein
MKPKSPKAGAPALQEGTIPQLRGVYKRDLRNVRIGTNTTKYQTLADMRLLAARLLSAKVFREDRRITNEEYAELWRLREDATRYSDMSAILEKQATYYEGFKHGQRS